MKSGDTIIPLMQAGNAATIAARVRDQKREEEIKRSKERKEKERLAVEKKFQLYFPGVASKIRDAAMEGAKMVSTTLPDSESSVDCPMKDRICQELRDAGYYVSVYNKTLDHGDSAAPAREAVFELQISWEVPR